MAALSTTQAVSFGRISKPSLQLSSKLDSAPRFKNTYKWGGAKRKRGDGSPEDLGDTNLAVSKKPKLSLPTTSSSIAGSVLLPEKKSIPINNVGSAFSISKISLIFHNLSQPARILITLHKFLLKALSIHYAHNGPHTPAELGTLLNTITKLWKERAVTQVDLQMVLALYEINATGAGSDERELAHSSSPFKLARAGPSVNIEYVGQRKSVGGPMSTLFNAEDLHKAYEAHIYALDSAWKKERYAHLSFLDDDCLDDFPKLAYEIGAQTAASKAHISRQRAEILQISNAAQLRNSKVTTSSDEQCGKQFSEAIADIESRSQDLRERIRARQLAKKAAGKPTAHQILRKHALGRIDEVTEILRMMQQQQQAGSKLGIHDNTGGEFDSSTRSGKVSFNLTQLRSDIRTSARVPISDEEVTMCLKLLSEELEGTWVRIVERKNTLNAVFVVFEGEVMSGKEVQKRLMAKLV